MEARSMHYCFKLTEDPSSNPELMSILQTLPGEFLEMVGTVTNVDTASGDRLLLATGLEGSHLLVHMYQSGLVTIDIQYTSNEHHDKKTKQRCSFAAGKTFENRIKELFEDKCEFTRSIPGSLTRGRVCPYFQKGDDTLYEQKDVKLTYEIDSQWQNIKIYETPDFGNMLCLDDDIMIAESDDIYTQTLLGTERNHFEDKTVLILGGGDGGLLYELLKHSPKFVLMVEIDIEVIKACRRLMRSICGDSLDVLTGDNYRIEIDDCRKVLQKCLNNKTKFDFIINDLSEYLLNTDVGYDLDFVTSAQILEMSMEILEHDGKYLSRGDAESCQRATKAFEEDIQANRLQYTKYVVDVPSYREKYCLYEIWRSALQNGV